MVFTVVLVKKSGFIVPQTITDPNTSDKNMKRLN